MMTCSACGAEIADDDAWMCPQCEHVVRTEVLGLEDSEDLEATGDQNEDTGEHLEVNTGDYVREESETTPGEEGLFDVNEAVTLTGAEQLDDEPPDARIIGELGDDTMEISPVFPTPKGLARPSISKVILYAPERSWRLLQPGAVPTVVDSSRSVSPLEALALALIDGERSIHEIQREATVPRNEIDGALLLLLDKGVIRLDLQAARDRPASVLGPVYPTEMTEEDSGEDGPNGLDRTGPPRRVLQARLQTPAAAPSATGVPAPATPATSAAPQAGGLPAAKPSSGESPPLLDDDLLEEVFSSGASSSRIPATKARPATTPAAKEPPPPKESPPKEARPPTLRDKLIELAKRSDPRARKLIDQAAKDLDNGEVASAQTNLKLATTFDPRNGDLRRMLIDVAKEAPREKKVPARVSQRTALLDQATERESAGDVDGAIELLERALKTSAKDAAIYNRLGVILATKKKDVDRGRELIERAVELAPDNETYQNNLGKVLARAATVDLAGGGKKGAKQAGGEGIFGIFGKKK